MSINSSARLFVKAGVLLAVAGCFDLDVSNPNTLDIDRAYISAASSEASIIGAWRRGGDAMQGRVANQCSALPLAFWANELTGTATLNGGLDPMLYNSEPRSAIDNTNVQNCVTRFAWYDSYSAIAGAREAFQAIVAHNHRYGDTTVINGGADTPRLKIFAKFVMAMNTIRLGLLYDQAFITDTTTNPQTDVIPLKPYTEVVAAGVAQMRQVMAEAKAVPDFTTPTNWVNQNAISRDELIRIGYSWIQRAEVYVARTPAERAAVNWAAVLARADSTITRDFFEKADPTVSRTAGTYINNSFANNTVRINNRFLGPADTSGQYQAWLGQTIATRAAFTISTPDRRIHAAGNANAAGTRFARQTTPMGSLATAGNYLGSIYRGIRYLNTAADSGARANVPYITVAEMNFIKAEAYIRLGQQASALALINPSRIAAGLKPVTVAGPPNDASCVPRKHDTAGTCGDLLDALKYEKRMELFPLLAEVSYFDTRGWGELISGTPIHLPPSGRDLASFGIPIYTFGGGGPGSAP
jgi:hypothetical protein